MVEENLGPLWVNLENKSVPSLSELKSKSEFSTKEWIDEEVIEELEA